MRKYETGANRDSAQGKPQLTYLPWDVLDRVAHHYEQGAEKYGDDNWRKGMCSLDTLNSLMRHVRCYFMGMKDEDHLSAIIFNALCLMYNEKHNLMHTKLEEFWKSKGENL